MYRQKCESEKDLPRRQLCSPAERIHVYTMAGGRKRPGRVCLEGQRLRGRRQWAWPRFPLSSGDLNVSEKARGRYGAWPSFSYGRPAGPMKFSISTFQPASRNGPTSNWGTATERVASLTSEARSARARMRDIGCSMRGTTTRSPSWTIATASSGVASLLL